MIVIYLVPTILTTPKLYTSRRLDITPSKASGGKYAWVPHIRSETTMLVLPFRNVSTLERPKSHILGV